MKEQLVGMATRGRPWFWNDGQAQGSALTSASDDT